MSEELKKIYEQGKVKQEPSGVIVFEELPGVIMCTPNKPEFGKRIVNAVNTIADIKQGLKEIIEIKKEPGMSQPYIDSIIEKVNNLLKL